MSDVFLGRRGDTLTLTENGIATHYRRIKVSLPLIVKGAPIENGEPPESCLFSSEPPM